MSEWKEKPLSELATLYNDSWKVGDEECPYIALEHIEEGKLRLNGIGHSDIVASNKYRFNEKNFLFGKLRPYFRKVVRPQFSGICSTDIWVVGARGETDLTFLFYLFANQEFADLAYSGSSGTRMPRADWKFMRDTVWHIPSDIEEQRAIASVLSSLDDKIDLLHRQNKTLEAMAETLFRQWFVEGADEGWEKVKIKDFNVIVTDYVANGSFAALAENVDYKSEPDYAVLIRLTDFNNNFSGDFVCVDEHAYNFLDKSKLFGGEIIISNVGAYSGTVFKCPILNRPMTLGPNSIVLKSEFNNYLYLFFKSRCGQYLLDGIISGSAQPKFNKTAFRNISLNYLSIEYIKEFENVVKPYFDKFDLNQSQIRTLEKLRDTLLPKLMSGEVRVKLEQREAGT